MYKRYQSKRDPDFLIRDWREEDRDRAAEIISTVLAEFGLDWQPNQADRDVIEVEAFYLKVGGQFWVVEQQGELVGTAAFYPLPQRKNWAEIRKMYLLPQVRNLGLGQFLLQELETQIQAQQLAAILIETSTKLPMAMTLYERNGYLPYEEVETARCDRAYVKYL